MKRPGLLAAVLLLVLAGCAGCMNADELPVEPVVLDVLYWDRAGFMDAYGHFIAFAYPEVEINVIPLKQIFAESNPYDELDKVLQTEKPDLMFVQPPQYDYLLESGALAPVDALLVNNRERYNPQVVSMLTSDGVLYGMAPTFTAEMMYLNTTAFESNGVGMPDAPVTWEEWFATVNRFQAEQSGMYGLVLEGGTPWGGILQFGTIQGLKFIDHHNRVLLSTPEWSRVANAVISSIEAGSMQVGAPLDPAAGDAFLRQQSAMAFRTDSYRTSIEYRQAGEEPFEWQAVPMPVSHGASAYSPIHLERIVAIPAASGDREAAMKIVSFLLGEEMSRVYRERGQLPTRIPANAGGEWERFAYLYQPAGEAGLKRYGDIMASVPENIRQQLADSGEQAIGDVLAGAIDVDEALARIEAELGGG